MLFPLRRVRVFFSLSTTSRAYQLTSLRISPEVFELYISFNLYPRFLCAESNPSFQHLKIRREESSDFVQPEPRLAAARPLVRSAASFRFSHGNLNFSPTPSVFLPPLPLLPFRIPYPVSVFCLVRHIKSHFSHPKRPLLPPMPPM